MTSRKNTYTDEVPCLDIHALKREGRYSPGETCRFSVVRKIEGAPTSISVTASDDLWCLFLQTEQRQWGRRIEIGWHHREDGRPYQNHFYCPQCRRNCRKLYLFAQVIQCQQCAGLVYRRQEITKGSILDHQIEQLEAKIANLGPLARMSRLRLLTELLKKTRQKHEIVRTQMARSLPSIHEA